MAIAPPKPLFYERTYLSCCCRPRKTTCRCVCSSNEGFCAPIACRRRCGMGRCHRGAAAVWNAGHSQAPAPAIYSHQPRSREPRYALPSRARALLAISQRSERSDAAVRCQSDKANLHLQTWQLPMLLKQKRGPLTLESWANCLTKR